MERTTLEVLDFFAMLHENLQVNGWQEDNSDGLQDDKMGKP